MDPEEGKPQGTEEDENFAELLDRSFVAPTRYEPGQKVEANVVKVTPERVFLDLGRKGEGVVAAKELVDGEGNLRVREGDTLSAHFVSAEGSEMLFTTRVAGGAAGAAQLEDAWRSGIPVDGLVAKEIKGGYEVRLAGGSRAFCPYSQIGLSRTKGPEERVGKRMPFRITQFGEKGRNIVVSNRVLLEEEEERKREALKGTLSEGMVVKGTVTSVREFGAFVNIGPIEGLLPVSEIGWERVADLREVLSPGQEVEVAITRLDWAGQRFSFSLKNTLANPWDTVGDRFPVGSRHVGKVARLSAYGAFVSLGGGIDGLLHVSKLGGGKRLKHPSEALREGQEVEVRVESVDREKHRVSLSLAAEEAAGSPEVPEEDYRKYLSAPSETPSLGSLGEALKAKLPGKKGK